MIFLEAPNFLWKISSLKGTPLFVLSVTGIGAFHFRKYDDNTVWFIGALIFFRYASSS